MDDNTEDDHSAHVELGIEYHVINLMEQGHLTDTPSHKN